MDIHWNSEFVDGKFGCGRKGVLSYTNRCLVEENLAKFGSEARRIQNQYEAKF